jgi:hypothetical protein
VLGELAPVDERAQQPPAHVDGLQRRRRREAQHRVFQGEVERCDAEAEAAHALGEPGVRMVMTSGTNASPG